MLLLPRLTVACGRGSSARLFLFIVLLAIAFCWDGRRGAAQGVIKITPVSAASFTALAPVAPGSIVSLFLDGDIVVPNTLLIGNDTNPGTPEIELPTLLGNRSVEIEGRSAGIFFLSPRQLNIILPPDLVPGLGPIIIRDATGQILAAGEIEIASVAPTIFTANVTGNGVPAAYILRARPNGEQRIEAVADYNPTSQLFTAHPIDLERGDETVFLILYLTGARRIVDQNETRVLIGGNEFVPDYVGPAPGFVGLEQINLRLPRSLPTGLLEVDFIYLPEGRAANACEIEVAPPAGAPPSIRGLNKAEALAGEVVEITGTGFTPDSEVLVADGERKVYNATMMESGSTMLKVMIPYGSGTGNLIVRNSRGEASFPFRMRTSMSGIVQRIVHTQSGGDERVGVRNATIRVRQNNIERTTVTNDDGSYLLPDVIPTSRLVFEVDGTTNGALPLPRDTRSLTIRSGRDNEYEGYIELEEISGPTVPAGADGVMAGGEIASFPRSADGVTQTSPVTFDPQGSTVRLADGTVVNSLRVTVIDPGRVPANLPPGQFSSTIVQLTPFGATLTPGGRLTFPNTEGYAANETVTLYRFDQQLNSGTVGAFVISGQARVTADGQKIETASNAIKESTYYFVSKTRPVTTIFGKVVEEIDGGAEQPARGALVQVRGQSIFSLTDQSGTFTLRNVPMTNAAELAEGLTIEVSFLRPDGSVDRVERKGVIPVQSGLTLVSPPIRIVSRARSLAPVILAPRNLTIEAGKQSDFVFIAYPRVPGQTLTNVQVFGVSFGTIVNLGNNHYSLRLTPPSNAAGIYKLEIRATDSQGATASEFEQLEVIAPQSNKPIALSQSLETNEDQPLNITLAGSGGNIYRVFSEPRHGRLVGVAPNLVYLPEADFNGMDDFSFVVRNGTTESAPAVVTISVRPLDDLPRLLVGDRFKAHIGERLMIVINGADGDLDQSLTLSAANLPGGATVRRTTATSWVLEWQPTKQQTGSYPIDLTLSDSGSPPRRASKTILITVFATWTPSSIIGGSLGVINSLMFSDDTLLAGTFSFGIYRSPDNGATWTEANIGLPEGNARSINAMITSGEGIYAGTTGAGIYRSVDHGATWTAVNNGLPAGEARIVKALTVKGGVLFAGTSGAGIYRSSDNGATWTAANNGLPPGEARNIRTMTSNTNVLFAGTSFAGIYRSLDNGASWSAANNGLPIGTGTTPIFLSMTTNGSTIFAGTFGGGIYRSVDNGGNWTLANEGLPEGNARFVSGLTRSGNVTFAGTSAGIYQSVDNGSSWTEANVGVPEGEARAVQTLTSNGSLIFAGTRGGGVFRSVDNGIRWSEASTGLPEGAGRFVQILAAGSETLFAGTSSAGIYRSVDRGATWTESNTGLPLGAARNIYALAAKGNTVFAGTYGAGLYRSLNNGLTWAESSTGLPAGAGRNVLSLLISGDTIIAGTGLGIYRSTDNGTTWTASNTGIPLGDARVILTIIPKGNLLFIGTYFSGIYRSEDNGATWADANNGLPIGKARYVRAITVSGNTLYAGTGLGIYQSSDDGRRWVESSNGLPEGDARFMQAMTVSGETIFAGTIFSGVYQSVDKGASWVESNDGLPLGGGRNIRAMIAAGDSVFTGTDGAGTFTLAESEVAWEQRSVGLSNPVLNAALLDGQALLVGSFGSGVFRSTDEGLSWVSANVGLPPNARVQSFARIPSGIFVGLLGDGIYFTSDQGANWAARNNGLPSLRVNALAADGLTLYAGTEGGVFRSTDQGASWVAINNGLTDLRVLSLAVSGSTLYAGTENGLFRSLTGGTSWTATNAGLGNFYILSLGFAPDGSTVLAGTSNGLYRSTNGGNSWARVSSGISDRVITLTFVNNGNKLLTGTFFGYYISEDQGASWKPSNAGLLNLRVSAVVVKGNQVFVGTRGSGVFVSQLE
jgi:uncharacterized protein (TIGR03437 family)